MRIEPFSVGSIIHVIKRGARGLDIVHDEADKWNFVKNLYILNDELYNHHWRRDIAKLDLFERPSHWPERKPLVNILAWVLMPNHFHLLLQERCEGGVSKFMQRLGGSMSLCFNLKYGSHGSIFQGAYKAKLVDDDAYLRYLSFYIQVKNVFELYPGGLSAALNNFDDAWEWSLKYRFSSLITYALGSKNPILNDTDMIMATIQKKSLSKEDSRNLLKQYLEKKNVWSESRFSELMME